MVIELRERLHAAARRAFGYDAVESNGDRRRPVHARTAHEDTELNARKRRILSATTHDLARNFAVAQWAIRRHLDYVTAFSFQANTGDEALDAELEAFVARYTTRDQFDIAARHGLPRALRITEACRVRDGDCGWLKIAAPDDLAARGRIQGIEGDRVALPHAAANLRDIDPAQWTNGLRLSPDGRVLEYAICNRTGGGALELSRTVPARSIIWHASYDRFDQCRGVSPVASALNWFRDCYEAFEYALAKVKVSQLFGLAFTREGEFGPFGPGSAAATADADGDGTNDSDFETALPSGVFSMDLQPGEGVEVLEAKTPAAETVDFLKLMIGVALKSLDIPFSFFDESFTNFYGSRGGLIQYLKSCRAKRADMVELLNAWTRWRLGVAVADGLIQLPAGRGFDALAWEWIPDGVPWWDPIKEVRGHAMGVAAGFTSPQRVCREVGTDFDQNLRETAAAMQLARRLGVPLTFADSTAFAPDISSEAAGNE